MTMKVSFPGGKKVRADYKGFAILTDQSVDHGGEGSAPSPFSLFLASLGTCTGFYVLAFCQKRGIDTDGIEMSLTPRRNEETKKLEQVTMDIVFPHGFPERYLQACVNAASLCAVKRALQDPPRIEINPSIKSE